ncbi:PIN/TRAM domain-containing protein [Gracilibacillus marinus]|uniref:PIN/TRAM domain-containing protein n=1 Tax=Gracilibacillus marinus TaxID=630535 RepID=A0ABV8VZQ1_9BACI
MLKRFVQLFFIIAGGTAGYLYIPDLLELLGFLEGTWLMSHYVVPYVGLVLGAIIFFILSLWCTDYILNFFNWVEEKLLKAPVADLLFGSLGIIIGLIIAYFLNAPIQAIGIKVLSQVVPIFLSVLLAYFGFTVGFKRRDDFLNLFTLPKKDKRKATTEEQMDIPKPKILDTSVIIDGRIADICQTSFLEGTIIIPQFVLEELQHIADSSDALKRNRGRRGLDILNRIQKDLPIRVEIYEGDFEEIHEVDSKLVKLAKVMNGIVVTNDFNLNKVCEFQKVPVLNINDLANAVKPIVLPGEELLVQVIKDGKEQNQGVAYLDDGTMIVVEEGKNYIGKTIDVVITSVLQTSAGRMIFAKPKLLEKAL